MEIMFGPPPLGLPSECRAFLPHVPKHFKLGDLLRFASTNVSIHNAGPIFPDMADLSIDLASRVRSRFKYNKFNPLKDYVVLIGDPIISAVCMFVLGDIVDNVVLLRYDGQSRSYWPFRVKFGPTI